ncbi:CARDB domain-containing protein [Corallococcus exercitus]|uniref:CARDB domain-containing protein n=1 Tax=Corallococcus exercitus TaxID=2316736 RepID=UPI0035D4F1C8
MPTWRHACLLIAGTLVVTGCGSEGASSGAVSVQSQGRALAQGSDLIITELRAPDAVRDGAPFSVTATVCNTGAQPAYPQQGPNLLQLYLSTTSTQEVPMPGAPPLPQQMTVGELDVGLVDAQQCVTRTFNAYPMAPPGGTLPGAYYLGASIDTRQSVPESVETNNGFVRGLMGLGQAPDLVVTEVKTPPDVRQDASFIADVRVCNTGTASSPPTQAAVVLSSQATLDAPAPGTTPPTQARVGEAQVPALDAGRCVLVRTQASAQLPSVPLPPGQPLYVGAIVDPSASTAELREDNNTRVAGRLGVGDGPDLVVTDVTGPATFPQGAAVPVSVTVCNVGTARAPEVRADALLSTLPSLTPSPQTPDPATEIPLAHFDAPELDAGRCVTLSAQGNAIAPTSWQPNTPLSLGARVEQPRFVPELRTDNNTFVKGLVGLGNGADLVVRSLKAPANVAPGLRFPVEATVCNVGTAPQGGSARLQLSLSTERAVVFPAQPAPSNSRTQVPVADVDVPFLSAGQCKAVTVEAFANQPQEAQPRQPLYLGATIDSNRSVAELREDNNTFTQGLVGLGFDADLVVTDVKAPANLRDGQPFTASYTVCNVGLSPVSSHAVALYLSVDAAPPSLNPAQPGSAIPGYAFQGRSITNTALTPGQCSTRSATFNALRPMELGPLPLSSTLNLSAVVDNPSDLRLDNNGFAAGPVGLGNGPDLVVTELQGPTSVRPGASFTSNVRVCNVGTQPSGTSSQVAVYLGTGNTLPAPTAQSGSQSNDGTVSLVGTLSVPALGTGACITQSLTGMAMPPQRALPQQPLFLGAVVDPMATLPELREDNNTFVAGLMGVGQAPDLVVTSLTFPDTVAPMVPFTATARLCNAGTEGSYMLPVMFVVSPEADWTLPPQGSPGASFPAPNQYLAGPLDAPPLQAGQCQDLPVTLRADRPWSVAPDAPLYLSAVVDPFQGQMDLRRDNNVSPGRRLGIGTGPDLVITSVTGPASAQPGPLELGVTVCNPGNQSTTSGPWVNAYLLTQPTLSQPAPNTPIPPENLLGEIALPSLEAHACVTLTVNAFISGAGVGPVGTQTFYLGAGVDRLQQVTEVREDNNTFVGPRIGVGLAPDVVITAVGGPAQVQPWAQLQVPVTVCNQGTVPAQSHGVELLLSTLATLPESAVQGDPVESNTLSRLAVLQVPQLDVAECTTVEGTVTATPPQAAQPGAPLYLGAVARLNAPELRKDNNGLMRP